MIRAVGSVLGPPVRRLSAAAALVGVFSLALSGCGLLWVPESALPDRTFVLQADLRPGQVVYLPVVQSAPSGVKLRPSLVGRATTDLAGPGGSRVMDTFMASSEPQCPSAGEARVCAAPVEPQVSDSHFIELDARLDFLVTPSPQQAESMKAGTLWVGLTPAALPDGPSDVIPAGTTLRFSSLRVISHN